LDEKLLLVALPVFIPLNSRVIVLMLKLAPPPMMNTCQHMNSFWV